MDDNSKWWRTTREAIAPGSATTDHAAYISDHDRDYTEHWHLGEQPHKENLFAWNLLTRVYSNIWSNIYPLIAFRSKFLMLFQTKPHNPAKQEYR